MKMITSGINYLSHEKLVISDYRACAQACSKMTTSFNGADKLINTPNPNVLMYIMLIVYVFTMWFLFPWYFATHNGSYGWLIFQLYCYSYTIGCLIFIARDMDNPFDGGTIDLPLEKYEGSLAKDLTVMRKRKRRMEVMMTWILTTLTLVVIMMRKRKRRMAVMMTWILTTLTLVVTMNQPKKKSRNQSRRIATTLILTTSMLALTMRQIRTRSSNLER